MLYYYATPVDQTPHFEEGGEFLGTELGRFVSNELPAVFQPALGWTVSGDTPPEPGLQRSNLDVLGHCAGLVAFLPKGVPTVGVLVELLAALQASQPVFLVTDALDTSWALSALVEDNPNLTVFRFDRSGVNWEDLGYTLGAWNADNKRVLEGKTL